MEGEGRSVGGVVAGSRVGGDVAQHCASHPADLAKVALLPATRQVVSSEAQLKEPPQAVLGEGGLAGPST